MWDRYASDEDTLASTAAAIREGHGLPTVPTTEHARTLVEEVEVEAQHVEKFQVSVPAQAGEATRREQSLVLAYADLLRRQGHKVTRHRYQPPGGIPPLICDLVDKTDHLLYEAKGNVERGSVRMAIGQLLDYRRFECHSITLAILLPRRPAQDLIELIHEAPATAVWRTKDGFASSKPPAASIDAVGRDEARQ